MATFLRLWQRRPRLPKLKWPHFLKQSIVSKITKHTIFDGKHSPIDEDSELNDKDKGKMIDAAEEENEMILEEKKQDEEVSGDATKTGLSKSQHLDSLALKFIEEHILGNHGPKKTRNQMANFQKTEYLPVMKCERSRGDLPLQVKMVTKVPLSYEETGIENFGFRGQAFFLVTGIQEGTNFTPQHLDGILFKRSDERFYTENGTLYQHFLEDGLLSAEFSGCDFDRECLSKTQKDLSMGINNDMNLDNISWDDRSDIYIQQTNR